MSTPRDGNDDDGTGRGWQEPAHLGGDEPAQDEPNIADRRKQPRDSDQSADPATWQPAGWDLPAAEPDRPTPSPPQGGPGIDPSWAPPAQHPSGQQPPVDRSPGDPAWGTGAPQQDAPGQPAPERRSLFGSRRKQRDPEMARAFTYQGDLVGAQGWAVQRGWTISDGTAPEDAPLAELIASAPVRMSKDHRPGSVLRGRAGSLDLVAFDGVYTSGRYVVPEYAITAAPLLGAPPALRLSPARLWKHGIGGMVQIPSDDPDFDRRWQLLAAEDGPQVRRLSGDADVRRLLLATDDGDEFWTSGGFLAAIRPDGHRPELIEHHTRLLTALVGALAAGY